MGHPGHDLDRRSRDGGCQMLVMAERLRRWGVELELAEAQARDKLAPPCASEPCSVNSALSAGALAEVSTAYFSDCFRLRYAICRWLSEQ